MLFRSTLRIFLLAIPSVLSERESKLPNSGGQSRRRRGQSRRRQLKVDKATVEPSEQVSEPCLDCGPTIVQRSYTLQSDRTSVSFGASEVPTFIYEPNSVVSMLETDSGFVPGIVGTVFVDRGSIVGIDGVSNMELDSSYSYTITCTVLEGDFVLDLLGDQPEIQIAEIQMDPGPSSPSSFEFSKVSCDIDVCDGIDWASNTPVCLHLRFSGDLNGVLDVLPILPTSGMYVRSRKLTDNSFPPYFGNDEFRASVLSGTAAWRGSIGEAAFNVIDPGIYRMDVGVLINDYGDLVAETVWE